MATVYDIEKALNSVLVTYGNDEDSTVALSDIAWANIDYEAVIGTPYINVDFVPATSASVGVGGETRNREIGFYQLTINTPTGNGKALAAQIVEELYEYFKRGTEITFDGTTVRCIRFQLLPALSSPDWFIQLIRVQFRADIDN